MGKTMTKILMSMFRRNKSRDSDLLIWAKTEYGNDWHYAYQHMQDNKGKAPKMGVYN
jgi:hypothetical protein